MFPSATDTPHLDAFSLSSQDKCAKAQAAGRFDDEIVPVPIKVKKDIVEFKKDEFPRATSMEALGKLAPAFRKDGRVTAGHQGANVKDNEQIPATHPVAKQVGELLDSLASLAYKEVKKGGQFVVPGFGKMVKVNRKARMGRNPATGAQIKIPAKTVVKFRLAKAAKDAVA